jgi:hypothetical protein
MNEKLTDFLAIFIGTRKFIGWLALFIVGIVFRLKGYVDGAQFVDLIKGTFLAFAASNSIEHFATTAKSYINSQGVKQDKDDTDGEVSG